MLQYIADVRQAVKYAVSDMEGTELPGFSIPKKVNRRLVCCMGAKYNFVKVFLDYDNV